MKPMMPIAGVIVLIALAAVGCSSKEKQNLEKFAKAQALFETAKQYVAQGKLDEAHTAYCGAKDIITDIRRRSGPARMGDYDLPSGPNLKGLTTRQWQELWDTEMRQTVERSFDTLVAKTAAGQLDWSRGRAFLTAYAPKLDDRWVGIVASVDKEHSERLGDVYLFECESASLENCEMIRTILAPKTAKPLSTEKFLSGNSRSAAFGLIQIKVELDNWKRYETDANDPSRSTASYSIPSRAFLSISVSTRRGSSSWDGEKHFTFDTELPPTLSSAGLIEAKEKHIGLLRQKVEQQLAGLEAQALRP